MFDQTLSAAIVFGLLLAICIYGLWISNIRSTRLNATTRNLDDRASLRGTTQSFETGRP